MSKPDPRARILYRNDGALLVSFFIKFLVLVKQNGTLDLPGGRIENGETIKSALQREIDEETGLQVEIHDPVEEWSFYKTPDQLINGITLECAYLAGKVKLCDEHTRYFWATIDSIKRLTFTRNFLKNLKTA